MLIRVRNNLWANLSSENIRSIIIRRTAPEKYHAVFETNDGEYATDDFAIKADAIDFVTDLIAKIEKREVCEKLDNNNNAR